LFSWQSLPGEFLFRAAAADAAAGEVAGSLPLVLPALEGRCGERWSFHPICWEIRLGPWESESDWEDWKLWRMKETEKRERLESGGAGAWRKEGRKEGR